MKNFEKEKTAKLLPSERPVGLAEESLEEQFFFAFVCRGSKRAYKQIEEFLKAKTAARVIFQRISSNYLTVSQVKLKPLGGAKHD